MGETLKSMMSQLLMIALAVCFCSAAPTTDLIPENPDSTAFFKFDQDTVVPEEQLHAQAKKPSPTEAEASLSQVSEYTEADVLVAEEPPVDDFSFEQAAARSKAHGSGELLQAHGSGELLQAYGSGELLQAYGSGSEILAQVHEGAMASGSDSAFSFEQTAARSKAYGSGELLQAYGSGELLQAYGSGSEILAQVHEGGMASGSDSAFSFEQTA